MFPLRLLLIEDSELDAGLILRQLKDAGYTTTSTRVENKAQLFEALKEPWDFIIADYRLPEFSATEALKIVQDSGIDTPFVIVSGAIGEETAVALMKSGARDYLMKDKLSRLPPVVERELIEANLRRMQKQAHLALLESERNLKKSQSVAHIGHWVMEPLTGKSSWSDELYRIMGLDPNSYQGDLFATWQAVIHPDDRERVLPKAGNNNILSSTGELEFRIIRPDGTVRYMLSQIGEPLQDSAGQDIQYAGVVHDITERKLIELDLIEKIKESQNRAHELEVINSLSSRMRQAKSRKELAHIMLHDMAQFLGADHAILSYLDGDTIDSSYSISEGQLVEIPRTEKIGKYVSKFIRDGKSGFFETVSKELFRGLPKYITEKLHNPASMISYPIIKGSRAIGVIHFDFFTPTKFNAEVQNFISTVVEVAGNSLNRMSATSELESMVELRERELESIYKVTSSASATLDIRQSFQEALVLTLEAVHTGSGAIVLLDEPAIKLVQVACQVEDTMPQDIFSETEVIFRMDQVVKQRKALVVPNLGIYATELDKKNSRRELSFIGLPMRAQNRVVGVLVVIHKKNEQVLLEEMTLLSFIADHLALIVENSRLFKKAERSAILEERSRLARELHDSVTQSLYSASLYSAGARRFFSLGKYSEVDTYLTQIGDLSQQALKDMRLLVYELRLPELKRNGFIGALQNRLDAVERRVNIEAEILSDGIKPLPELVEENLYRIAIESLNNSLKYAHATKITLNLFREKDELVFSVQDNGIGFQLEKGIQSGGVGLATMRERAERIGASYKILTLPEKGTKIEVRFSSDQKTGE